MAAFGPPPGHSAAPSKDGQNFVQPLGSTSLNKVDRLINRLPRMRDERARREREQEEWRSQLNKRIEQEQHERRQWREQQEKFDQLTNDVDQWGKAERVRAYAAA